VYLLLAGVLTADHVLNDALHSRQDGLVVAEGQHVGYLGIQQGVDHGEHLGFYNNTEINLHLTVRNLEKDYTGLSEILVQDPDIILIGGVLDQGGQHGQHQYLHHIYQDYTVRDKGYLSDMVSKNVWIQEIIIIILIHCSPPWGEHLSWDSQTHRQSQSRCQV
jgi:hypothetical protein